MTRAISLLLGKEPILLNSRALILKTLGYQVFQTQRVEEARLLCESEHVDLLILCHTVSDSERVEVLQAAKRSNPVIRCLWLLDFYGNAVPDGATGFYMTDGPTRFVRQVQALSPR